MRCGIIRHAGSSEAVPMSSISLSDVSPGWTTPLHECVAGFTFGSHVSVLWEGGHVHRGSVLLPLVELERLLVVWDSENSCSVVPAKSMRLASRCPPLPDLPAILPMRRVKLTSSGGYSRHHSKWVLAACRNEFRRSSSITAFPEEDASGALSMTYFLNQNTQIDLGLNGEDNECFLRISSHPEFQTWVSRAKQRLYQNDFVFVYCKSGKHRSVAISRAVREALSNDMFDVHSLHIELDSEARLQEFTKLLSCMIRSQSS